MNRIDQIDYQVYQKIDEIDSAKPDYLQLFMISSENQHQKL